MLVEKSAIQIVFLLVSIMIFFINLFIHITHICGPGYRSKIEVHSCFKSCFFSFSTYTLMLTIIIKIYILLCFFSHANMALFYNHMPFLLLTHTCFSSKGSLISCDFKDTKPVYDLLTGEITSLLQFQRSRNIIKHKDSHKALINLNL